MRLPLEQGGMSLKIARQVKLLACRGLGHFQFITVIIILIPFSFNKEAFTVAF